MTWGDDNLSRFAGKLRVQCCTHPDFFSRGIPHRCKVGFSKIWLCATLQRLIFRKFWQGNLSDCHFYRNFGFTNIRIAFFTEIPALQTLHTPVFFFQRHSAHCKAISPKKQAHILSRSIRDEVFCRFLGSPGTKSVN